MIIDRVQRQLEAIYGIECGQKAREFVVTQEQANALGATGRAPEELLVAEEADGLSLGLYFSPELLARLERFEDSSFLDSDLSGYCELAEGVSHFLYVVRAAEQERTVSLLELEAQAEVDKFASCVLSRWSDGEAWAKALSRRLFDEIAFRSQLSPDERRRYEEANRLAKGYCARLLKLIAARRMDHLLAELRHSYRMGADAKLDYLSRAA